MNSFLCYFVLIIINFFFVVFSSRRKSKLYDVGEIFSYECTLESFGEGGFVKCMFLGFMFIEYDWGGIREVVFFLNILSDFDVDGMRIILKYWY